MNQLEALQAAAQAAALAHAATLPAMYTNWQNNAEVIQAELVARWAMQKAGRLYRKAYRAAHAPFVAQPVDMEELDRRDNFYPGAN